MPHTIRVTRIAPNLSVGNQFHCFYNYSDDIAVIHVCQDPCHQHAVGYRNSLPTTHPNYWFLEDRNHLYLNIINSDRPIFYTATVFVKALAFIRAQIDRRRVLIHSNEGLSRGPSVALLYLAKMTDLVSDASYDAAAADFSNLYPQYQPQRGIVTYLRREWENLKLPSENGSRQAP
ncbi:MAG: dual specificity protein phosphatase family protein [Anaerolineae bacterium]|nr:dual specificity protein phosphatase family protein [Anaerolineae bacterium]